MKHSVPDVGGMKVRPPGDFAEEDIFKRVAAQMRVKSFRL
jgi:hypothetical protein